MGKRTCAKKAQEPWVPDPTCRPPTGTWKDELTGEERAEEKSKMQVRKKKSRRSCRISASADCKEGRLGKATEE